LGAGATELVIFDCDGVLVDTEHLSVEVEVGILGELGWEITPAEIAERFLGISDADYVAKIEAHLGITLPPSWLDDMSPRYRAAFERDLQPVDGIVTALDALESAGIFTGVASSGTPDKMRFTLGLTGLWDRFEGRIFSATEVSRGKPAPDLFLHAASTIGVQPVHCAVVEDSPAGVQASLAAGMRTIAYAGGLVPLERLALPGVTVISDMRELAPLCTGRVNIEDTAS
jgi:HAD superfamily hydrolase (TIGR01509 family)